MPSIAAAGAYLPAYAITADAYAKVWGRFASPGVTEKRVAGYDEDPFTLGLEAARAALTEGALQPALVAYAASETQRVAASLCEALGLPEARAADFTGSPHASGAALLGAFDFVAAQRQAALVVAAGYPRAAPDDPAEHPQGAGTAALLVSPDNRGGARLLDWASSSQEVYGEGDADVEGHPRYQDLSQTSFKAGQRAMSQLLKQGELSPNQIDRVVVAEASPRRCAAVIKGLLEPPLLVPALADRTGDLGAANLALALFQALATAQPQDKVVALGWGGGSATALALEVTSALGGPATPETLLATRPRYLDYATYALRRGYLSTKATYAEVPMGAAVTLAEYQQSLAARYRLEGQRCAECRKLIFPPRNRCPACGSESLATHQFTPHGTIYSHTLIGRGGAPSEFARQQDLTGPYAVALVQLEEGPRVAAMVTDFNPQTDNLAVGAPVRLVVRRLYRQQGVWRYGFKCKP